MDDLQKENERLRHRVAELESRSLESSLRSVSDFGRSVDFDLGHALGHLRIARPQDDDTLIESYEEPVREAWKQSASKGIRWHSHEYLPLARLLRRARLPRVDFEIFKAVAEKNDRPVNIQLETGTEAKYRDSKADACPDDDDFTVVWCNRAATESFGYDVESINSWEARAKKTMKWIQLVQNATLEAVFIDQNYQPFREVFFKFGQINEESDDEDWNPADVLIMQATPCLFRCSDDRVYFGTIEEPDAKPKYAREVYDRMVMPLAIFRYTEIALCVFDLHGNLLQQNATSMKYFGLVAAANTTFIDEDETGKPVNRLRWLFGQQYDQVMEAVRERGAWRGRKEVLLKDLKPRQAKQPVEPVWFHVIVTKFRNPTDGGIAIYVDLKDITKEVRQEEKIRKLQRQEQALLKEMMPEHIIQHLVEEKANSASSSQNSSSGDLLSLSGLQKRAGTMAEYHPQVTVFFCDIVGFTQIAARSFPGDVMDMLNELFSFFDNKCDEHDIYKVETIGDAYMCCAGLSMKQKETRGGGAEPPEHHARRMVSFAKDILASAALVTTPDGDPVQVRIGLHSGDVMTGVVGHKMPRFCLFGDTVNVASRMESTGRPGLIHVSQATRNLTPAEAWISTGGVEAKGKGLMETYILNMK